MGTQEFGEYLRSRREAQGLSIDDVSELTKIHIRHIRAIEEGRLEALPGIVYAKAFVRHYARAVGEDPDAVAVQFHQVIHLQGESDTVTRSRKRSRRRTRRESRFPWPWIIVIIGLAALGFLIAKTLPLNEGVAVPPAATPSGITSGPSEDRLDLSIALEPSIIAQDQPVEAIEPSPSPAGDVSPANVDFVSEVVLGTAESEQVNLEEQGEDGQEEPIGESVGVALDLAPDAVDDESPATDSAPEMAAGGSGTIGGGTMDELSVTTTLGAIASGVVLEVDVERACWFNVEADGVLIFSGVLDDGESATWVASEELRVRYGRPEGVFITLNGEFLGRAGTGVITRVYGREGVIQL